MGRITVCRNPLQPDQLEYFRHAGPFIDWLQVHFPDGFGAPTIIVCNGRRLHTPDFDYVVGPDDEVYLVADPGEAIILGALVSAAISAALSFVTDWIFATPDSPSEAQQPSPVYSLSVPTNQARLGQVVPVQYGEVLAVPDIASQPYTWFANNEQYLGMLLCLGQGEFQVDSVQVADTPEDQLAANVVVWQDFGPGDHQQTMGVIQAQTGVWENVDTSPEVSDQELVPGDIQTLFATGIDPATRTITFADPIASAAVVGGELELSDATPNNGTYTIESIAGDRH